MTIVDIISILNFLLMAIFTLVSLRVLLKNYKYNKQRSALYSK